MITVAKTQPLRDLLLGRDIDEPHYAAVAAALRSVLAASDVPVGAVVRILIGPSRATGEPVPQRLSLYFPDPRDGKPRHAATVALSDGGRYVLAMEPPPIGLPDGTMLGTISEPASSENGKGDRYRPVAVGAP